MGRWSNMPRYGLYAGGGVAAAGFVFEVFKFLHPLIQAKYTKEIKPERIFDSEEVSCLLGTDHASIVNMIEQGVLTATKGDDGDYKIIGQSIINYMASPSKPSVMPPP